MIETTVERWHQHLRGELPGGLDSLLHPDCMFVSPIVFTPQKGRDLTKLYLGAAGQTLGGDPSGGVVDGDVAEAEKPAGTFRYVKEVVAGDHAVLEFETSMDGTFVNGVDIITCDAEGLIVEFKVMIRPLQAIEKVHAAMRAMLEQMTTAAESAT
jgi:hypothetical protein